MKRILIILLVLFVGGLFFLTAYMMALSIQQTVVPKPTASLPSSPTTGRPKVIPAPSPARSPTPPPTPTTPVCTGLCLEVGDSVTLQGQEKITLTYTSRGLDVSPPPPGYNSLLFPVDDLRQYPGELMVNTNIFVRVLGNTISLEIYPPWEAGEIRHGVGK
ncbi:hypothetical protein HY086_05255 [Candidatus Gottesmanbacteria bacterium]|nr:hypothetical protein [Candidatus Gottesmanbacteria bacterium]